MTDPQDEGKFRIGQQVINRKKGDLRTRETVLRACIRKLPLVRIADSHRSQNALISTRGRKNSANASRLERRCFVLHWTNNRLTGTFQEKYAPHSPSAPEFILKHSITFQNPAEHETNHVVRIRSAIAEGRVCTTDLFNGKKAPCQILF